VRQHRQANTHKAMILNQFCRVWGLAQTDRQPEVEIAEKQAHRHDELNRTTEERSRELAQ
jgi:hypothetical protein